MQTSPRYPCRHHLGTHADTSPVYMCVHRHIRTSISCWGLGSRGGTTGAGMAAGGLVAGGLVCAKENINVGHTICYDHHYMWKVPSLCRHTICYDRHYMWKIHPPPPPPPPPPRLSTPSVMTTDGSPACTWKSVQA